MAERSSGPTHMSATDATTPTPDPGPVSTSPRAVEHIEPGANHHCHPHHPAAQIAAGGAPCGRGGPGHPGDTVHLSISDLARRAATSEATVVRLCQRAGFAGYPELRLALATAVGRSSAKGSPSRLIGTDVALTIHSRTSWPRSARPTARPSATRSRRWTWTCWRAWWTSYRARAASRSTASEPPVSSPSTSSSKLRRIGLSAAASTDGHLALTSAAVLTPDDVAVGISHGGETLDILDPLTKPARPIHGRAHQLLPLLPRARRRPGARPWLPTNPLFRAGAMASRTVQLAVVDCIYLAVAQRRYDGAVTALDHTSAALRSRHQGYA